MCFSVSVGKVGDETAHGESYACAAFTNRKGVGFRIMNSQITGAEPAEKAAAHMLFFICTDADCSGTFLVGVGLISASGANKYISGMTGKTTKCYVYS